MTVFLAQEVEMTKGNCSYHYDQKNTYVTCTEWLQKVLPSKWDNGPNRPCRPVWPVQPILPFPVLNLLQSLQPTKYGFNWASVMFVHFFYLGQSLFLLTCP